MNDDERKVLDAEIAGVLSSRAFRAMLANGHAFTAFVAAPDAARLAGLTPGVRVKVELSSGDLSKGRIVAADGMRMST